MYQLQIILRFRIQARGNILNTEKYTGHAFEGGDFIYRDGKVSPEVKCKCVFYGGDLDEEDKQIYSSYYEAVYGLKMWICFVGLLSTTAGIRKM